MREPAARHRLYAERGVLSHRRSNDATGTDISSVRTAWVVARHPANALSPSLSAARSVTASDWGCGPKRCCSTRSRRARRVPRD